MSKKTERRGLSVNRNELADIFGVSLPTITAWVRRGCPYVREGGTTMPWEFNTAEVGRWMEDDSKRRQARPLSEDEQALRLRKLRAEVLLMENELQRRKLALAPVAQLDLAWSMKKAQIHEHVMAVPDRVAAQLVGEKDEARFKRILATELLLALEKAAAADIELSTE